MDRPDASDGSRSERAVSGSIAMGDPSCEGYRIIIVTVGGRRRRGASTPLRVSFAVLDARRVGIELLEGPSQLLNRHPNGFYVFQVFKCTCVCIILRRALGLKRGEVSGGDPVLRAIVVISRTTCYCYL